MSTHVTGLEQLTRVSAKLRAANRDLRLESNRALREATKPLPDAIRRSAEAHLPKGGGLAANIAASKIRTVRRASGSGAGITITTSNAYLIGRMNKGKLRHRVWGGEVWVSQSVTPRWWTDPIDDVGPRVKSALEDALENVARRIGG